ncbi:MAG: SDR family NAD(P)-dependent oxidoreductase, partial [Muribaculaceae bacterium]|nr:SDR family NAD(P)-dependent oxidoreductase [Muribaculaceae bacterium]
LLACYNTEKSQALATRLTALTGNDDITTMQLDLSSFYAVKQFANKLKQLNRPVAALINNASYISRHSEISPDGYEKLVQVNFLSTVLLTLLVEPLMVEGARIVFTTSLTRNLVSLPYEFPAVNSFMPITAYAQSKLALTLFSIYLSTTLRTKRIQVNCADHGIVKLSLMKMRRWIAPSEISVNKHPAGAQAIIRAIESGDTGFIFKGGDKMIKTSKLLKNREVFIKLCNDTMRVMKKHMK